MSTLFILLFLICIPPSILANRIAVPHPMRDKMARAPTFAHLAQSLNIMYYPNTSNHHNQRNHPSSFTSGIRIEAASVTAGGHSRMMAARSDMTNDQHAEYDDHMEILNKIKQGSDTCKLQKVCIPVETPDDPSVLLYPMCYDVMRCVGSCCHSGNTCHPHSTKNVSRIVVELGYVGSGKFKLNRTFNITMEEHTSCSCYQCSNVETCPPGLAIGPSCTCECPNQDDKVKCTGQKRWREDQCKCECPVVICSTTQFFDEDSCSCTDEDTHISQSNIRPVESHATDIANLPKLTKQGSRRNHNRGINT